MPDENDGKDIEAALPVVQDRLKEGTVVELAILSSRDIVLFPGVLMPLLISDSESLSLIDDVLGGDKSFGHITMKGTAEQEDDTRAYNLYEYGCRAVVLKMLKMPDGKARILVQGGERFKLVGMVQHEPYLKAKVQIIQDVVENSDELLALTRTATNVFINVIKQVPYLPVEELQMAAMNITSPVLLSYLIAANMNFPVQEKQKILEENDVKLKLERIIRLLNREMEVIQLGSKIQNQLQSEITKAQKDQLLREQMRIIQQELGEEDDHSREMKELKEKVEKAKLSPEAQKAADEEIARLARISPASAEYSVSRTYLDWLVTLPWSASTNDMLDIKKAQKVLDDDHYGLEKVKERILEYLAVRKLKNDMRGPILCFVGPPGVGKTSLGRSIARALGRNFYRMSLGGIRDEAEVRGHRRTYVGALPGRIIQGIRKAGSNNPIFMLDEVDKIGQDFRGDPSSALLEVLDPEQNFSFSDHYLEVPFDLSKVMFITTANILDTIPPPLQDRMEILELPGYTEEEKIKIAQLHLIPKQLKEHGLDEKDFTIDESALCKIISSYARESGVRNLEREIATLCRKIAKEKASGNKFARKITANNVADFLGPIKYFQEIAERTSEPGVATGLAWTRVGGDILFIEATRMKGNKGFMLTGHLGEVMKESAQAALSYIRAHAKKFKIQEDFFRESDIHVHVPAGAIPKDGPSAGVTMAISLISLLTNRPVRSDVAMTGEITLRGKVLPVGGIKEKVLAAKSSGIKTVLLPKKNMKDIEDIPLRLTKGLHFEYLDTIEQAVKKAFK
ncbi:MAG: endopeptidase La [Planctomycetes bacterium]|nr:endopeptidase La [Planctomycetota bacterium]